MSSLIIDEDRNEQDGAPIAVSAPGKVLLAGGYLVLDRAYTGLVFGLNARIHALVQPEPPSTSGVVLQEITVRSPQFREAVWIYGYRAATQAEGGCLVTQLQGCVSFLPLVIVDPDRSALIVTISMLRSLAPIRFSMLTIVLTAAPTA